MHESQMKKKWIFPSDSSMIMIVKIFRGERVMVMALAQATKSQEATYTIDHAMDVLLAKLDEAIDDMENGRVQTIEEAWEEIDAV